jgi:hypothetical protein
VTDADKEFMKLVLNGITLAFEEVQRAARETANHLAAIYLILMEKGIITEKELTEAKVRATAHMDQQCVEPEEDRENFEKFKALLRPKGN